MLMGEEEKRELLDLIDGWHLVRFGKEDDPAFKEKTFQLEQLVAERTGVRYAVATNSGTSALLTALSALGVGPGDEVIVPGYTFVASISSIIYARAIPVLAEIDRTLNLDPEDVRVKITPRTKAIVAVHMLGNSPIMDEIKVIADERDLLLVEDCAQAFGASYHGKPVGSMGDMGIFSFNVFKMINAGEGGMAVTDDETLYRRAFAFHDQGHSPLRKDVAEMNNRVLVGLNLRMAELTAAVLIAQVRKTDRILEHLRANKKRFKEQIADLPGIGFREISDPEGECATLLTVIFPDAEGARRIAGELGNRVVAESGWHVYNNMEQIIERRTVTPEMCPFTCPYYKGEEMRYHKGMLPQTDDILGRAMNISIGVVDPGLGAAFGISVIDGFNEVDAKAEEFRRVVSKYL
jgi:dTDP-4-amino-4,6-dideoxygalactose transaminase